MENIAHLLLKQAKQRGENIALHYRKQDVSYRELLTATQQLAERFLDAGCGEGDRVAIYLPKLPQTVAGIFAAAMADAVFVPVNPQLKAPQVRHIIQDADAKLLLTSKQRWQQLVQQYPELESIVTPILIEELQLFDCSQTSELPSVSRGGNDLAALMYTSGSTGLPKGVMFSHRNIIAGAESVCDYLHNTADDCLLALLPFSFDYGLNQLFSSVLCGARLVLLEFLLPNDVVKAVKHYQVTGIAGVPPLWHQLSKLDWQGCDSVRYITNSGGALEHKSVKQLQQLIPSAQVYLMYGLTEAFRSTYLEPELIDVRKGSMGKAIPGAEIYVIKPDGSMAQPGEVGELVHRGVHVSQGYWKQPVKTQQRFRPIPGITEAGEVAVWSGDLVKSDADGFLYFVARGDEMIKTSGYRVSPNEVEQVLLESPAVEQVVVFGAPDERLGQHIIAVIESANPENLASIKQYASKNLPAFMQPQVIFIEPQLPKNANGKLDRASIKSQFSEKL